MKRYILIIILGLLSLCSMAQEKKFIKGFSGGMMAHTGYQFGGDNPYGYNPKGATFGIGGVARLHLSEHFRTGFEAGALADCFWKVGRLYPYVGATIGGGMETAYYMFAGDSHDWLPEANVVLNKQPFFAVDPFVGCDIAVGEALRLTVKVDWLMAIHHASLNRPMGPRIYFGCIFAH